MLQINQAVFVEGEAPATLQMLRLVSHYVAHGTPTLKVPARTDTSKMQPILDRTALLFYTILFLHDTRAMNLM